jgi:hypothetical protein
VNEDVANASATAPDPPHEPATNVHIPATRNPNDQSANDRLSEGGRRVHPGGISAGEAGTQRTA